MARFTTTSKAKTFCGTLQWTAPEVLSVVICIFAIYILLKVLSGIGYTTKADVYRYGIRVYGRKLIGQFWSGTLGVALMW